MPWLLRVLVLVAILAPAAGAAAIERDVRDRVVPAAVQVAFDVAWIENGVRERVPYPAGSGTIVSPDGLVLTNFHVVDAFSAARRIREFEARIREESPGVSLEIEPDRFVLLASDGRRPPRPAYRAELAALDPELDLAVLRIVSTAAGSALPTGTELPTVPIGDSDALGLGDAIHIFGYPAVGGDALTYTSGVVSGFNYESDPDDPAWINTDAVMSGGSSGGTAVNDAGELIGVPTQGTELDCRPGDTDGDGAMTVADVGCIPTGGSIGQLRPIALALPLLRQAAEGGTASADRPARPQTSSTFDFYQDFEDPGAIEPTEDERSRYVVKNGALVLEIKTPGAIKSWLAEGPTNGASIGFEVIVGQMTGYGELFLLLDTVDGNARWAFTVDPVAATWTLFREAQDGALFVWVEPRSYAATAAGPVETIEVRVTDGIPGLLINGVDVVAPTRIEMPDVPGSLEVGFGAGINRRTQGQYGQHFVVEILQVRGYER